MKISELERMLAGIKSEHGDLQVRCGPWRIGALVVLPPPAHGHDKVVPFVLRNGTPPP